MIKITNRTAGTLNIDCIGKELTAGESLVLTSEALPQDIASMVSYGFISIEITADTLKQEEVKTKKNKYKEE